MAKTIMGKEIISEVVAMADPVDVGGSRFEITPDNFPYLAFAYSGKPRVGLYVCDDDRNPNNIVCYTLDGIRTFKKDGMVGTRNVTSLGDGT